jgi:hypothetical protein
MLMDQKGNIYGWWIVLIKFRYAFSWKRNMNENSDIFSNDVNWAYFPKKYINFIGFLFHLQLTYTTEQYYVKCIHSLIPKTLCLMWCQCTAIIHVASIILSKFLTLHIFIMLDRSVNMCGIKMVTLILR